MARDEKGASIGKVAFSLFAILVIASVSIFTVVWQEASPTKSRDVAVEPNGVLQSFLSSTIDEVSYTDKGGNTTSYIGWTVYSLLVEDLEIRSDATAEPNKTGLNNGIEKILSQLMDALTGSHHFNIKVSFRSTYFRISDANIQTGVTASDTLSMKTFDGMARISLIVTE